MRSLVMSVFFFQSALSSAIGEAMNPLAADPHLICTSLHRFYLFCVLSLRSMKKSQLSIFICVQGTTAPPLSSRSLLVSHFGCASATLTKKRMRSTRLLRDQKSVQAGKSGLRQVKVHDLGGTESSAAYALSS